MSSAVKIANRDARRLVEARQPFKGSHLFSEWNGDRSIYTVYSYGYHWPLVVYVAASGIYYLNTDKYSPSTSRHLTNCRPWGDCAELSEAQIKQVNRSGLYTSDQEEEEQPDRHPFAAAGMVAAFGALLTDTQAEANTWKKRMLSAGVPGLDFPEDFDSLPEDEKQRRLDAVIKEAKK